MGSWIGSNYSDLAGAIQAIAGTLALILGGLWTWQLFVRHRQRFPRAKVSHTVEHRALIPGRVLLHVTVELENTGDVLLRPVGYLLRVQQVLPLHPKLAPLAAESAALSEADTEFPWPTLGERRKRLEGGTLELEPGESDRIYCDVVIPDRIQTVEVYSHFDNGTKPKRRIGWSITTLYDLQPQPKTHL